MASTTFLKYTGFTGMLGLLLLGILLPSVLSVTTMAPNTTYAGMNGTAMSNTTSMSMIYCPSFMCNYSDCYTMYDSQNATCISWAFCQLLRQTDICYVASCVASCADSCVNASQTNCSVNCCNSTGCLNSTFASMMMMTTTTVGQTAMTQSSATMTTSSSTSSSSATTSSSGSSTSMNNSTVGPTATTQSSATMSTSSSTSSSSSMTPSSGSSTSMNNSNVGPTATTQPSATMTTSSSTSSSSSMTSSSASSTSMNNSNVGQTAMTQSSATMTNSSSTGSSSSMTSSSGSSTSMNNSTGMNGTTMSNTTSMSMVYCPSFMCNYTDCYTMYDSQNATACSLGCCQLMRQTDICYVASCVASCADSCVNASQTNCSVNCCNSTGCLNGTFASMMMTTTTGRTTTMTTTTATTRPTTTMTASSPTADNGKKCHQGTCTGSTCYTNFANMQTCSSTQPHCQLKKETVSSNIQWTAGCTTNCSSETPCKKSTTPPCHLECCNATMTSSCLWLNGTLNVPNSSTRGHHLNTELVASLLCLLAITLLL